MAYAFICVEDFIKKFLEVGKGNNLLKKGWKFAINVFCYAFVIELGIVDFGNNLKFFFVIEVRDENVVI